ncbi:Uncharacterized protein TPAR_04312 [Tolypocladium paradoxum]|uniref:Aminoglycoside phosphotransferase domain-containing protein n=1 Tax=Tolypocladium paradoxum TaxID=94208 RepID=A0A2S4KZ92_9HYPO|nr:Uncharacterized protein TPAR_04312 [Tolypocladium paradoxum]
MKGTWTELPDSIHFWFGPSLIHASPSRVDDLHLNVLRLQLRFNRLDRGVRWLLARAPSFLRNWASIILPRWTLPPTVILKREEEGAEEAFDNELRMYKLLKPLQGTVVPKLYGMVNYKHTRALLLSDIGGLPLYSPKGPELGEQEFHEKVGKALRALHSVGVDHDDVKLDNYHLVGDDIFVLDHELSSEFNPENSERFIRGSLKRLWYMYSAHQRTMRYDGLRV